MKEAEDMVVYVATQLTGDPDCFQLASSIDENGVLLRLSIDQPQAGRIIGRRGSHAMALRTLLHALGYKNGARYNLKIDVWEGRDE